MLVHQRVRMIQWIYFEINLQNHQNLGSRFEGWTIHFLGVANELTHTRHTHLTKHVLRGLGIQNEQLGVPLMRLITCYMMRSLMKSAIWSRAEKWVWRPAKDGVCSLPRCIRENVSLTPSQLYFNWPRAEAVSNWTREKICRLWVSRSRRPMILMTSVSTHDSQLSGTRVIFGGSSRLGTGSITIFITQWGKG